MNDDTDQRQCPRCGATLEPDQDMLEGLCPDCVGRLVMDFDSVLDADVGDETGDDEFGERLPEVRPAASISSPFEIGTAIGPYKLVAKIGEGGFGTVYRAVQQKPIKREVAIKIVKLGMDTEQVVARFEAERQALALMDHPNIAKVYEAGATSLGRPYFVMELVHGTPITDFCDNHRLPNRQRLELFIQVCHAIQHAHQKGIIHRDIKPSNILTSLALKSSGDIGSAAGAPAPQVDLPSLKCGLAQIRVIDFGIAKATQMELTEKTLLTEFNQFLGTPAYMSPEQMELSGADVDTRSDIYSLGVLLYELLVGSTPFDTTKLSYDEVRQRIRHEDPPRPSTRLRSLSGKKQTVVAERRQIDPIAMRKQIRRDLDHIVMKTLEKDRTRRYETANGLALDVQRYLDDEPVLAMAPSQLYRFRKLVQRNRGAFAAAVALILMLVVGAGVSTWQAVRATRSEKEQIRLRQQALAQAYASDMNLAQQALMADNLGRTRRLLNRHRPSAGNPDLRGWEWRYLWDQSQSDADEVLFQLPNAVYSLSVSPDGQWLAVGERIKGGATVWDLRTKEQIAAFPAGHLVRVAFSPVGRLLAFSSLATSSSSVYLWDGSTGDIVAQVPLNERCMGMAFSSDGSKLATFTGASANQGSVWRIPDGTRLADYSMMGLKWDGVGNWVAVNTDFTVGVHSISGGGVRVFDPVSGAERWKASVAENLVFAVALSPDGKLVAAGTGLDKGVLYLWDAETGKPVTRWEAHLGFIHTLTFLPDGKTLVSGAADQTIGVWDVTDPTKVPETRRLRGHRRPVLNLAVLENGRTLASGGEDGSVLRWDAESVGKDRSYLTVPGNFVTWSFAADSRSVMTADIDGRVVKWQGADFDQKEVVLDAGRPIASAVFSENLEWLATESDNGELEVWDLLAGEKKVTPLFPVVSWLRKMSSDGTTLIGHDRQDDRLKEWRLSDGRELGSWESPGKLYDGVVSPDSRWLIRYIEDGRILLTDRWVNNRDLELEPMLDGLMGAAFSADGRYWVVTSYEGLARVWETATGREKGTVRGFLMGVHSAAFSPDGKRLATTSTGAEAVKLWDMDTLQELLTLDTASTTFQFTKFSPDGNLLGTMTYRDKLHLWRAPSWSEIESDEKQNIGPSADNRGELH